MFKDKDGEVFDTLLSVGSINQSQTKLKTFKDQGKYVHGVYRSHFHFFCPEQTLVFFISLTGALLIIPLPRE